MVAQIRTRTGRAAPGVIVDTALELFCRDGVAAVSLAAVADAVGVSKAALYHHFKTKDAIVLAALQPLLTRIETLVAQELPAAVLADALVDAAVEHRGLLILCQPLSAHDVGPEVLAVLQTAPERIVAVLAPDGSDEARTRARAVLASIAAVVGDATTSAASISELRRLARLLVSEGIEN